MEKLNILSDIIKERRSTFTPMYTGEQIEDDIIWQILENANWAPNHRKTEPWRFQVYAGDARNRMSKYQKQYYLDNTPEEKQNELKLKKTINNALLSSHVIAIIMHRDPEERVPEWEEVAAVSCAVQNMYLTVTATGYGCYWSSPGSALNGNEFFQLAENETCLGYLYIGVPKDGLNLKAERGDIRDKVKWMTD